MSADESTPGVVRVSEVEGRCGVYEMEERPNGYEVPARLWQAVLDADVALERALAVQHAATMAVVQHIHEHHPENEIFTEWARQSQ